MPITLDHVVLEVRDPEASVAFYRDVLRLRPVRLTHWRAGKAPFPSGRVDAGTIIDFFPPALWEAKRPRNPNHLCFTLTQAGVAALRKRLVRHRVPIQRESPRNYGARGWGVSFYFADPDGITLEARYYPAKGKRR